MWDLIWYSWSRRRRTEDTIECFGKTIAGQSYLPFRCCECGLLIFFGGHFEPLQIGGEDNRRRQGKTLVMPGLIITQLEIPCELFVRMLFHHFIPQVNKIISN